MSKIERKYLAHFINAAALGEDKAQYERLGKDLEEFSPELSAQVETRKNILGQTSVVISGYEKTGAVEPYYAEEGSALFARLQDIIDEGRVLEDVKTDGGYIPIVFAAPSKLTLDDTSLPLVRAYSILGLLSLISACAIDLRYRNLHLYGYKVVSILCLAELVVERSG
jgi:hypothetical protein